MSKADTFEELFGNEARIDWLFDELIAVLDRVESQEQRLKALEATPPPEGELLGVMDLCQVLSVSRGKLLRLRKRRDFPRPIMQGKYPRWSRPQINHWLETSETRRNQHG